jgi:transitional endoplasmic reticulum ATPase
MRFTIRTSSDSEARADATLLAAMGLPGGGVVKLGTTHVLVRPGSTSAPSDLMVSHQTLTNSGLTVGSTVDVARANLPSAQRIVVAGDTLPLDGRHLTRALAGRPISSGDRVAIPTGYGDESTPSEPFQVVSVAPDGTGTVSAATAFVTQAESASAAITSHVDGLVAGDGPTTSDAMLAGLDTELETLTAWISLLTSADHLPEAWGLPTVAGIVLEGPPGCGKSELVMAAATAAGATVAEVTVDLVFKPERLVDVLEKAVKSTPTPAVLLVDRIEAVAGDDAMFRTQVAAIMRWFFDAVAERDRLACVLGVSSRMGLDDSVAASPLLPRTLTVPPPDLNRRALLFESALRKVPWTELDFEALAGRTAGFSGADVVSSVVHASALSAGSGTPVTMTTLLEAAASTVPSLGSVPTGEVPNYGFEKVANLTEVKQRLTESVIWPITDPDRFGRLGIEPPRGLLLYGPPGTGKTYVIRALANESGAAFFPVKGAELLDKFVGESERGVREVFGRARAAAPAIIFFDELDALAPVRGRSTNSVTDSVVAALLTEMDGVSERGDVVVIGATNRKDLIDPALLRAGRLETHLELGLPEESARRALLGITDIPFADDVDLDEVAEQTEGLSFADITGLLREAALAALRADSSAPVVGKDHLDSAIARLRAAEGPATPSP